MNNIPMAEVSIPMPGVNINSLPVAQNVTPVVDALENVHPAVTIRNSRNNLSRYFSNKFWMKPIFKMLVFIVFPFIFCEIIEFINIFI